MPTAAIFDLDRTLLPGSSATVFQKHLAAQGLLNERHIPGQELYRRSYEWFGENPIMMQLARFFVRSAEGWPIADVDAAAEAAATELEEQIQPYARKLIADHKAAGRKLVLATTSPAPLVSPLARRLGFDAVVASEWVEDGVAYTGEADGDFVWGRAKARAVENWARANGIDLSRSYAYSDSAYDAPLLSAVGSGVAVNPDPQLTVIAAINGWEVRHLDVPPGVAKIAGREIQDWLRPLSRPEFVPNARWDIAGIDNIPATGGAIVVFNHRSYFDSTAVNLALAQSGRPARFLGKKEVFDAPIIGKISAMVGGIRVDRGTGSDEPLERAIEALTSGELVAMAPQGTIPRGPAFFEPELKARWGAAKLAHASKVPVIPMGLWGTEKVWPRAARLPRLLPTDAPEVTIRVGRPVKLKYRSLDADTKRIMEAIVDLLPPEAREHRTPTPEELALTYPPGYAGDPEAEADRRPGTDT